MLLLVPGGLWEDVDAERFWTRTAITAALSARGLEVRPVDRLPRARSWADEVDHVLRQLPARRVSLLAGSNGCSAALRLVLDHATRVERLVLAWPATAGDPAVDAATAARLAAEGAGPEIIEAMLGGGVVRGVTDAELATVAAPVAIVPADPADPAHQRLTVDALRAFLPRAVELHGAPAPLDPRFAEHRDRFAAEVAAFVLPPAP